MYVAFDGIIEPKRFGSYVTGKSKKAQAWQTHCGGSIDTTCLDICDDRNFYVKGFTYGKASSTPVLKRTTQRYTFR